MTMLRPPAPSFDHLDDEELERLAVSWRAEAMRGNRAAFGTAHALEVEQRRRQRASQLQQLPPEPAPAKPWWKFWKQPESSAADIRR